MALYPILRMGDPRLLQKSDVVTDFGSQTLIQLIDDMLATMANANGVGLAAPQIGILQRVVIFEVKDNPRYPDVENVSQTILINPQIELLSETRQSFWEGCLSIPGMRGLVSRPNHIRYTGFDIKGDIIEREASGFHAVVVQHECDHLDGILYPMRMKDLSQFGFCEELEAD